MPHIATNWTSAFTLYTQGKDLAEIARIMGVDLARLKTKAAEEGWQKLAIKLRDQLPVLAPDDPNRPSLPMVQSQKAEAHLERIRQNRETNFKVICALRDDLMNVVGQLGKGELKLKRFWCHQGAVTSQEVDPSPQDRVALATYAQTIMNLGYQALGDRQSLGEREGRELGPNAAQNVQAITVILPGAIVKPSERNEKVIDVQVEQQKTH